MGHYVDVESIHWPDGKQSKRENDTILCKLVSKTLKSNSRASVITLPADKWCFETSLSKALPETKFHFTGIEANSIVFGRSLKTMRKLEDTNPTNWYTLVRGKALKLLEQYPVPADVIYLDWMGTWSNEKKEEIETIFSRKLLKEKSMLIFTIWACRGNGPEMDELEESIGKYKVCFPFHKHISCDMTPNIKRKTYGVVNRIYEMAESAGYKAAITHFREYYGNGNQPQFSFAFTIKAA